MVQSIAPVTTAGHPAYERWMSSQDIPIHRGHYIAKPGELELSWWADRQCNAAFIQLDGMQGVSEARITEIGPAASIAPVKMIISEIVYVLEGQGLATVWSGDGPKKTFEFQKHSLFCLPRHCWNQLSNARGDKPVRLLQYNYLPPTMACFPEPDLIFNNSYDQPDLIYGEDFYAEATMVKHGSDPRKGAGVSWQANFIPDMSAWDKLVPYYGRGAGGSVVRILFPRAEMNCHMAVFDPQTYKKGHRHGPGRVIVIPKGEGYSILIPGDPAKWVPMDDAERVVCRWEEGTIFVPPENWYHQHFNTGTGEARYLALGPQRAQFQGTSYSHQIEYPAEEPWIRDLFKTEIGKKGMDSLMPQEAYDDPDFEWDYGDDI
jgi:oxalate decarboxylase/phosphoglucose isomerase-like protein (cupin superfamily)